MSPLAIDVTDLQEDRGLVETNDQREPFAETLDLNRSPIRVKDLRFVQSMLQRGRGDDRLIRHPSKITCGPVLPQGTCLWSARATAVPRPPSTRMTGHPTGSSFGRSSFMFVNVDH